MVANEVHMELLRMADERAKRAELRAMALEHEVGINCDVSVYAQRRPQQDA